MNEATEGLNMNTTKNKQKNQDHKKLYPQIIAALSAALIVAGFISIGVNIFCDQAQAPSAEAALDRLVETRVQAYLADAYDAVNP